MQDASDAFATAAATHRTWMPPRVRTDWEDDGYDGDGTADDLSPQASEVWEVAHDLDDGYPSTVSFISGSAIPELTTEMGGRAVDGVPRSAAAYWSPLRTDSPVYGYDRDTAPVTHDVGLVTADGPEYVRIFTGQMTDTPVRGGTAQLKAISATRIALMRPVLPPAFPARYMGGLRASWVVSWCLFACGIYAGPKIREGSTTLYYPMHGSFRRFLRGGAVDGNQTTAELAYVLDRTPSTPVLSPVNVGDGLDWVEGPYVAAPALQVTATLSRRAYQSFPPFDHDDGQPQAFTQAANAGRVEMWVRGDAADVNNAPGGSASISRLVGLQLTNTTGGASASLGVRTDRQVCVEVYDGTNRRTLTGGALPTDGAWHFVGLAYDMTADKLWANLDGTVSSSSVSMSTSALPATTDDFANPFLLGYIPFSDFTFSTGPQANVDDYPLWRNDASFAPTARVGLSQNSLVGLFERTPREAWQIIAEYAQSELAVMRCTEIDEFEYLTLGWWVKDAQQQVTDTLHTGRNAAPFDVDYDPTKVRNSVTVSYSEASIPLYSADLGAYRRVFELQNGQEVRIDSGIADIAFTFSNSAVSLNGAFNLFDDISAPVAGVDTTYVTLNSAADGTGTYETTQTTVTLISWHAGGCVLRFNNPTGVSWYLANDVNVPGLVITGLPVTLGQTYATDTDAMSAALRGQRALPVQAEAVQTSTAARRLARNLKMNLREPKATIGDESSGITVTADPRRQPGDLVHLVDSETGVSGGEWRLHSVRHKGSGAAMTQEVVARETFPVCIVGQSLVGYSLVGPRETEIA